NDKLYRQGRRTLTANGRPIHGSDVRSIRAMGKKTAYGQQLMHTSWLMHEYTTLEMLYAAGAAVPRPVAAGTNAILMAYIGDERIAAPTLNQISLDRSESHTLFVEVMRNVALLLAHGRIHGDLSAYNILYWQGRITLIDFPQVVNSHISRDTHAIGSRVNPDAFDILERDITRVCDYFRRFGITNDPRDITDDLWWRYTENDTENKLADLSWYLEEPE
ncbi:MAG: RIO1 family regulatory kinase/ATPase, partial [Anaerolineae bacterium]